MKFSRIIRRAHLYFALFLMPWLLIYALSTIAMNHRPFLEEIFTTPSEYTLVEEKSLTLPEDINNRDEAGKYILNALDMAGAHRVRGNPGNRLTIERHDPVQPMRITFLPESNMVRIDQQNQTWPEWLEYMHRRRGYNHDYLKEDLWALVVDVVIFTIVGWALTGLWMWWEIKATRKWGAICLAGGTIVFALFLVLI